MTKFNKIAMSTLTALSIFAMPVLASAEDFGGANKGTNTVPVTVEYTEEDEMFPAKAMIPTSINISGKTGTYHVMAYYETDKLSELNANLSITPASRFTLTKSGTQQTTEATVSQTKTTFTPNDVKNGKDSTITVTSSSSGTTHRSVKEAVAEGTISAPQITVGSWTGNMTFTIS